MRTPTTTGTPARGDAQRGNDWGSGSDEEAWDDWTPGTKARAAAERGRGGRSSQSPATLISPTISGGGNFRGGFGSTSVPKKNARRRAAVRLLAALGLVGLIAVLRFGLSGQATTRAPSIDLSRHRTGSAGLSGRSDAHAEQATLADAAAVLARQPAPARARASVDASFEDLRSGLIGLQHSAQVADHDPSAYRQDAAEVASAEAAILSEVELGGDSTRAADFQGARDEEKPLERVHGVDHSLELPPSVESAGLASAGADHDGSRGGGAFNPTDRTAESTKAITSSSFEDHAVLGATAPVGTGVAHDDQPDKVGWGSEQALSDPAFELSESEHIASGGDALVSDASEQSQDVEAAGVQAALADGAGAGEGKTGEGEDDADEGESHKGEEITSSAAALEDEVHATVDGKAKDTDETAASAKARFRAAELGAAKSAEAFLSVGASRAPATNATNGPGEDRLRGNASSTGLITSHTKSADASADSRGTRVGTSTGTSTGTNTGIASAAGSLADMGTGRANAILPAEGSDDATLRATGADVRAYFKANVPSSDQLGNATADEIQVSAGSNSSKAVVGSKAVIEDAQGKPDQAKVKAKAKAKAKAKVASSVPLNSNSTSGLAIGASAQDDTHEAVADSLDASKGAFGDAKEGAKGVASTGTARAAEAVVTARSVGIGASSATGVLNVTAAGSDSVGTESVDDDRDRGTKLPLGNTAVQLGADAREAGEVQEADAATSANADDTAGGAGTRLVEPTRGASKDETIVVEPPDLGGNTARASSVSASVAVSSATESAGMEVGGTAGQASDPVDVDAAVERGAKPLSEQEPTPRPRTTAKTTTLSKQTADAKAPAGVADPSLRGFISTSGTEARQEARAAIRTGDGEAGLATYADLMATHRPASGKKGDLGMVMRQPEDAARSGQQQLVTTERVM